MAKVQLCNVVVLDNPSPFLNPFQFELTFECIEELKEGEHLTLLISTDLAPFDSLITYWRNSQKTRFKSHAKAFTKCCALVFDRCLLISMRSR